MLTVSGQFSFRHFRDGKLLREWDGPNTATTVGVDELLDVLFNSGSQPANWTIGLIDGASGATVATSDTMASHPGWTENVNYSQSPRPSWVSDGPASSYIVTNSFSPAQFSITEDTTVIWGAFLVNTQEAPGDTTGTMFAATHFGTDASLNNGDTLEVTYTLTLNPT